MAKKTFISYKYSEAQVLRDRIIKALGVDANFYKGETSESPDLTDTTTESIKKNLCDMMYHTSVTIVIISPKIKESKWIDWEIEYCLKKISRNGRKSQRNGIVAVIMKIDGGYDWFKYTGVEADGHTTTNYRNELVFPIITNNRANQDPKRYCCSTCQTIDRLSGSYISYIEEDEFIADPARYIENAYNKSENDALGYTITPTK